jgi:hypothetical protein
MAYLEAEAKEIPLVIDNHDDVPHGLAALG